MYGDRGGPLSRRELLRRGAVTLAGAALLDAHVLPRALAAAAGGTQGPSTAILGDGGWSWFAEPRAIHHAGRHRRTYAGWIDRDGDLVIAAVDHDTRAVTRHVLRRGLGVDDHNNPALLIDADGRLTVFYSAHAKASHIRVRRALHPEDITSWGPERGLGTHTTGLRGETYPNALHLAAERRTYLFWRGANWSPVFSRRTGQGPWSRGRTLLHQRGERPYVKVHGDGARTIHIAYTDGNPGSLRTSIYYLRYRRGAVHHADGRRVAAVTRLPLAPSRGDLVYDARATGVRAWVWDVAAHRDGRPVIVYVLLPDGSDDCAYVYAVWNGRRWEQHVIVNAGARLHGNYAPGIALDHDNPNTVYLSRRIGGRLRIQRWHTTTAGANWTQETLEHAGAEGDAIRPVAVRGGGELDVLWMQGRYVGFRDYRTDIVGHFAR